MSYLNALRLHFSGKFQAAVSTVNNDPAHFDNATFKPEFQVRPGGWWNPRGDANWRMIGCNITSAWLESGAPAAASDPVLQCTIADSDLTAAAKLADLDPAQQMVSEIWGLVIRIADATGNTLLHGNFEHASFISIWQRWPGAGGSGAACATYQSVLTDLEWGDVSGSPFLAALRAASADGLLSIKFNVDAYDGNLQSPTFTLGRVAGTIGPASKGEPRHFVLGRHFMTTNGNPGGFFSPAGQINFCEAALDSKTAKLYLDLGNALPVASKGGPPTNIGALSLAYITFDNNGNSIFNPVGGTTVDYLAPGWYETTAGLVTLPTTGSFPKLDLENIAQNPLAIMLTPQGGNPTPSITEPTVGLYLRADRFVYRMNPGESASIDLYATNLGVPYTNAVVIAYLDSTGIGGGPQIGVPTNALEFPSSLMTDSNGRATLTVKADDPRNPRGFIDGQVYGIRAVLADTLPPALQYPFNPSEFISFLVWDEFKGDPPVWFGNLQPVFQQYANLYPIMQRFLDLASYDSICENLIPLRIAFGLGMEDANSMPVTRDLSASKRKAILTWLTKLGPDGKPLLGAPPPLVAAVEVATTAPAKETESLDDGKLAAIRRVRAAAARRGGRNQ
jgi:hypothetical protein